ncbi:MAG: hypothetical protein Q8933_20195 [Bacteroidota bacterium]|nr:hypothetical protein [Bacteroidota bacterium]MDP4197561.1 hypothetical protein [Bacteroidota bacterium]
MKTIIIICVYLVVVGTWIIWELRHAPQGFQDEKGFHDADEKEDKEKANMHSTTTSA